MEIEGTPEPQCLGKFQILEVVAICDHLGFLISRKLKEEIAGKAVPVTFDLLIQPLGLYPVQRSQVHIQHDPQAANHVDTAFNTRHQ